MVQEKTEVLHKEKGLSIEQIKALYFDEEHLIGQPEPVYRLDNGKLKFYYTFDEEEFVPNFYLSVTGFTDKYVPKEQGLIDWMISMGKQAMGEHVTERSHYGMLMDICFGQFLISRKFDLSKAEEIVFQYCSDKHLYVRQDIWIEELKKDILSFAQWVIDYDVVPIAIQIMLGSEEMGLLGKNDLVCKMNQFKYSEKTPVEKRNRVKAIVDYKSSKSVNFYMENEIQLGCYRQIWNDNFPEDQIEHIYNWSGKNWRSRPGYNLKDQTQAASIARIPHYLEMVELEDATRPQSMINIISGNVEFGKDLDDNYRVFDPVEFVKQKMIERL